MPAQGPGWGGSASGIPANGSAPFAEGNSAASGHAPPCPLKSLTREQAAEQLAEMKWTLAHTSTYDGTRLAAINSLEERLLGRVPQANINANLDALSNMTDEEVDRRIAEMEAKLKRQR